MVSTHLTHLLQAVLNRMAPGAPVHLGLARRSWDDAEDLALQMEAAHAFLKEASGKAVVAVAAGYQRVDSSYNLTQALILHLAAQFHRAQGTPVILAVVEVDAYTWAQQAVQAQRQGQLPPRGLPEPAWHPFELVQELVLLSRRGEPGRLYHLGGVGATMPPVGLGDLLEFYHGCAS